MVRTYVLTFKLTFTAENVPIEITGNFDWEFLEKSEKFPFSELEISIFLETGNSQDGQWDIPQMAKIIRSGKGRKGPAGVSIKCRNYPKKTVT